MAGMDGSKAVSSLSTHSSLNAALTSAADAAVEPDREAEEEANIADGDLARVTSIAGGGYAENNGWKRGDESCNLDEENSEGQRLESGSYGDGRPPSKLEAETEDPHALNGGDRTSRSEEDLEPFGARDLELIELALQSLQERSREQRGSSEEPEITELSLSSSKQLHDVEKVERLLKKVQAVRSQNRLIPFQQRRARSRTAEANGEEEMDPADICHMIHAASNAALMAANAAETVANSVGRNSQALEELCKTLTTLLPKKEDAEVIEGVEEGSSNKNQQLSIVDFEVQQIKMTKKILRQNTITHCVLGFMIVSTFVWRWVVVKFVKKVNNAVHNPLQGVTNIFDGFKNQCQGQEPDDNDNMFSRLKFPSFNNDDDEAAENKKAGG